MNLLELLSYTTLVSIFGVAAYMDFKTRIIPDKVWIFTIIPTIMTILIIINSTKLLVQYIASIIVGGVVALLCYIFNITGGADIKAIALLSIACLPKLENLNSMFNIVMNIPTIAVICNTSIPILGYTLYILLNNIKNFNKCREKSELRGIKKFLYMLSTMCVPVEEVFRNPHKYAISSVRVGDKLILKSITKIVYDDPIEELRRYIDQGLISKSDNVLVLYYIPYVTCIFIGLVMYILLGNIFVHAYQLLKNLL